MNAWSNIEISPQDPEITEIDKIEKTLGDIPGQIQQIRELITRFEVCHFKYQQHLQNLKESVLNLRPNTEPSKIGSNHIQKGKNAWKNDKTGRSLIGQQYLEALNNWLAPNTQVKDSEYNNKELGPQVTNWLGDKNSDKKRLVRLLKARLIWNWKSLEKLQQGEKNKEIELQVCRIDVCHYAFPKNLNLLLKGIGEMRPIKAFEGCGSFTSEIKILVEKEFSILNDTLKSLTSGNQSDKNELVKVWLFFCLAKTLKEQVGLKQPIHGLVD